MAHRGTGNLKPRRPGEPRPAAKPSTAAKRARRSAKAKLEAAVKQRGGTPGSVISAEHLGQVLEAAVIAYEVGSQDISTRRRRTQLAAKKAAAKLGCDVPVNLMERVKGIVERRARGIVSSVAGEDLAERERLAEALAQESDFLEPPDQTTAAELRAIARKAAKDAPFLEQGPTVMTKAVRDPSKRPNDTLPPPGRGGAVQCPPDEAERRVAEIVKRLGLGATRQQLMEWARKSWPTGCSERNVDEYIKAARLILRANWAREREDFMLDLLEQYQRLGADARVEGQLGTALGCLNSMAKLTNLGGFAANQGN